MKAKNKPKSIPITVPTRGTTLDIKGQPVDFLVIPAGTTKEASNIAIDELYFDLMHYELFKKNKKIENLDEMNKGLTKKMTMAKSILGVSVGRETTKKTGLDFRYTQAEKKELADLLTYRLIGDTIALFDDDFDNNMVNLKLHIRGGIKAVDVFFIFNWLMEKNIIRNNCGTILGEILHNNGKPVGGDYFNEAKRKIRNKAPSREQERIKSSLKAIFSITDEQTTDNRRE